MTYNPQPLAPSTRDCARLRGRSAASCWCKLPNKRGWAPCPPKAQGVRTPPVINVVTEPSPGFLPLYERVVRAQGYTGNACTHCDSMRMRQNGTCEVCDDCGETGACG
jgi:hypothetical protein